jgi:hypothetical protein
MANVVIDIAAQYTGNKAFKQAESATAKLEKSVAKLGKQLIGVFAAGKLLSFGKSAAKAFAADEKAARSLSLALANTGNAFRGIEVEKFIADLQRATGVLDDNLRPAFRTLLTATGDVTKSQEGLKLALDISAGTGKDLGAVSMALAKAYGGQTTALSRLGAGLSKATLKTGDMDVIVGELTDKFKGQALAAAQGYSGQLDRLAVAAENSKEIIGKGLLDSLALLSGPDGISKSTKQMEDLATAISDTVYGLAILVDKLQGGRIGKAIFGTFGDILSNLQPFASIRKLGSSSRATPAQSPGERKQIDKINADALKFQKQQNSLKKIDNDLTTRKITLTADQQALEEIKKKFDVERIGLFAALNNATDKETQMRLKSLIAIHDNDAALAGKIKAEMAATAATTILAGSLKALSAEFEFERMRMALGKAEVAGSTIAAAAATSGFSGISPIASSQSALDTALKLYPDFGSEMDAARSAAGRNQVSIQINPAVAGLIDVIQNQSASGISPTVNRVSSSYIA